MRNNQIVMGGDSAASSDFHITRYAQPKVFQVNDQLLLGFAGSFRQADILRHKLEVDPFEGRDLHGYLATHVVDKIRKLAKKNGLTNDDSGPLLLGIRKKLFVVDVDYHIGQCRDPYAAIGCASEYALGAFHSMKTLGKLKTRKLPDMKDICRTALKAAAHLSPHVCSPFHLAHMEC